MTKVKLGVNGRSVSRGVIHGEVVLNGTSEGDRKGSGSIAFIYRDSAYGKGGRVVIVDGYYCRSYIYTNACIICAR